jgi:hypothetical protein
MNLRPTIHDLRSAGGKDAAILDLLHLLELHEPPVRLRVDYLLALYHERNDPDAPSQADLIGHRHARHQAD